MDVEHLAEVSSTVAPVVESDRVVVRGPSTHGEVVPSSRGCQPVLPDGDVEGGLHFRIRQRLCGRFFSEEVVQLGADVRAEAVHDGVAVVRSPIGQTGQVGLEVLQRVELDLVRERRPELTVGVGVHLDEVGLLRRAGGVVVGAGRGGVDPLLTTEQAQNRKQQFEFHGWTLSVGWGTCWSTQFAGYSIDFPFVE